MSREPSQARLDAVIAANPLPKGWRVIWRTPHNSVGQFFNPGTGWVRGVTDYAHKVVECVEVCDRASLLVYLHELAHIVLRHDLDEVYHQDAQCEYEAEAWAMAALRASGLAVPRSYTQSARAYVQRCIALTPRAQQTEECLRFAYGKDWQCYSGA